MDGSGADEVHSPYGRWCAGTEEWRTRLVPCPWLGCTAAVDVHVLRLSDRVDSDGKPGDRVVGGSGGTRYYARFSGRTEAVDVLEKRLSIFEAVRRGEPDLVSKVLSENPDSLNHAGAGGRTPLHIALDQPSTAMLERLLQEGADPNTPLPTGESPLQRAVERGETAKVLLLVSAGADPDRLDQRGRGPLYSAIGLGNAEMIHILLQHGANPNLEFAEGLTPLQAAAQKGQTDTVQLLLSKGGRAEAQNENGRDALYWARKHRHYSLASILEETLRGDDD